MPRKRDTYNYDLLDGRRVVYRGISKDPERRIAEHERDGKEFTRMVIRGAAKTETSARIEEAESLARYRRSHGGDNPDYNLKEDG